MIRWLRRAITPEQDPSPPHEERVIPATDSERRFDVVRGEAERVMRRAEESNQQARRQAPSWEELLVGKERG